MILSIPCRRPWRFGSVFGSGPQGLGVRVRVAILLFRVGVLEVDGELVRYRGSGSEGVLGVPGAILSHPRSSVRADGLVVSRGDLVGPRTGK